MTSRAVFWISIITIAAAIFAAAQTDTGRNILHLIATGEAG